MLHAPCATCARRHVRRRGEACGARTAAGAGRGGAGRGLGKHGAETRGSCYTTPCRAPSRPGACHGAGHYVQSSQRLKLVVGAGRGGAERGGARHLLLPSAALLLGFTYPWPPGAAPPAPPPPLPAMAPPPMPAMAMLLAMLVLTGGTPKKGVVKEVGK
ncbi:hypothetical protein E2C01_040184 [Portunus trituberculatus]|uniref:Uncharacterized protein n=1 Tax=Portunus trituberculatus TaxID=210409 RepID=A0A5B7FQ16_PORTR|nr:hypothetical protein [Portunus trituberculatus]